MTKSKRGANNAVLNDIAAFKPNWDFYGAQPIAKTIIDRCRNLVNMCILNSFKTNRRGITKWTINLLTINLF